MLFNEEIDKVGFSVRMQNAIEQGMFRAFADGAAENAIRPDEYTPEERAVIEDAIQSQIPYISGYADAILESDNLSSMLTRANLWVNKYEAVRSQAIVMTGANKKYIWLVSAVESCDDCMRLKDKIKRASVWNEYGYYPQHPKLACMASANGVVVCDCRFEETTLPCTPGKLPLLWA